MELETFDNVYTASSGHHWYGHVSDVAYDNQGFINTFKVLFIVFVILPLMIAIPSLLALVLLIVFARQIFKND